MLDNPRIPHLFNFWDFLRNKENLNDKTAQEMADYFNIELDYAKELIQRYKDDELINPYDLEKIFD